MSTRLSRTKLARYVATELLGGNSGVVQQLAAYLVDEGRTGETELVLKSIYDELEQSGVVSADIVSADGIDANVKDEIKRLLGAKQLILNERTDPSVLGGVRITTTSRVLDATIKHRLTQLQERKV